MSVLEARRLQDFAYYAQYLKIEDKATGNIVPFVMNPIQQRIRERIIAADRERRPCRLIILKARRMGASTVTQMTAAHRGFTRRNFTMLTIAHDNDTAGYLFGMVERALEELPAPMRPPVKNSRTGKHLNLETGSRFRIETAEDPRAGRGTAARFVHCSEVSHWPNAQRTMAALKQIVPRAPGTAVIIESTANGVGDYFHKQYLRAKQGKSQYEAIFFPWFEFPDNSAPIPAEGLGELDEEEQELVKAFGLTTVQLQWRRNTIADECDGDIDYFHQEYPATDTEAFLLSGRPFFGPVPHTMRTHSPRQKGDFVEFVEQGRRRVRFVADGRGPWHIWTPPEPGVRYGIFADTAGTITEDDMEGFGEDKRNAEDFCAAQVVDMRSGEQVAEYQARIDPDLYAYVLARVAYVYNKALVAVEANGGGVATLAKLYRDLKYPNLYRRAHLLSANGQWSQTLGWSTNVTTRPQMLETLRAVLRERPDLIKSARLVGEMKTFILDKRGKPCASPGTHDDLVMAAAGSQAIRVEYPQGITKRSKPDPNLGKSATQLAIEATYGR